VLQSTLFLCCDSAALDARLNTISAFHIAEQLNAASFPVVIPRLSVIGLFAREETDPSRNQLQLQIHLGPQQLFAGPLHVDFMQGLLARTIFEVQGLVVTAPGSLRFDLRNGDAAVASWVMMVNQVGQPEAQMVFPAPPPAAGQPV
jgi:hypothetical protein